MDVIISALGLIVSELLKWPARAVAVSDIQKARLAKTIFGFIEILDRLIVRGYEILEKLDMLPSIEQRAQFIQAETELIELVEQQLEDLRKSVRIIQYNYGGFWPHVGLTDVRKVLTVYEPDLGDSLRGVIGPKSEVLTQLASIFSHSIEEFKRKSLIVREVEYVEYWDFPDYPFADLMTLQQLKEMFKEDLARAEKRGIIRYRRVNLSIPQERREYLSRAAMRLKELEMARTRLADLLKEHFEPQYLL